MATGITRASKDIGHISARVRCHEEGALTEILTVGHGTHPQEEFLALLDGAGVEALVDIRIGPGSRRHPHFARDALEQWLPAGGVEYRWEQRLGGFRKLPPDPPDIALRNESFRAYAGYMRTEAFEEALAQVVREANARLTILMCSESVWWRCHRRLVADHLVLLDGIEVRHLMPDGRLVAHPPTDGARVADGRLVYDAAEGQPGD